MVDKKNGVLYNYKLILKLTVIHRCICSMNYASV